MTKWFVFDPYEDGASFFQVFDDTSKGYEKMVDYIEDNQYTCASSELVIIRGEQSIWQPPVEKGKLITQK